MGLQNTPELIQTMSDEQVGEAIVKFRVGTNNQLIREQWLEKTLKAIPAGLKILDAGAGELQYKKFCSHLEYVSQDFAEYDGTGNHEGFQTGKWDNSKLDIVSDIIDMPVPDKSFDAVMCIEVFEHIPQPALAIKEFSRVLKSGGTVIITAPFCSLTHFAPYYFANGYSKYWYERILSENGFEVKEITPNGNYFEYLGQEVRRIAGVAIQYSGETEEIYKEYNRLLLPLLEMIDKFNHNDKGSSELLNLGYHVVAIKK